MFALNPLPNFSRKLKKIVRNNKTLKISFRRTMNMLADNPRNPVLKSHKVIASNGEKVFSSRVTADLRII